MQESTIRSWLIDRQLGRTRTRAKIPEREHFAVEPETRAHLGASGRCLSFMPYRYRRTGMRWIRCKNVQKKSMGFCWRHLEAEVVR